MIALEYLISPVVDLQYAVSATSVVKTAVHYTEDPEGPLASDGGLTKSRPHDRTRPHSPTTVRSCGRTTLITTAAR